MPPHPAAGPGTYVTARMMRTVDGVVTAYRCTHNHLFVIIGPHAIWDWPGGRNVIIPDGPPPPPTPSTEPDCTRWTVHGCRCGGVLKREAKLPVKVPRDALHAILAVGGYSALTPVIGEAVAPVSGRGVYVVR